MNVYDSGRMADLLAREGYEATERADDADLVLLNTCHIREKAAEKVYSQLGRLRALKERRRARGRETAIAVAGCVAQAEGEEMARRAPVVDVVVGPQSYHRLPELLDRARRRGRAGQGAVVATDFPPESKFDRLPPPGTAPTRSAAENRGRRGAGAVHGTGQGVAFLSVQEGCDRFCTFCVVPYTRGAEASRPAAAVLAEARRLLAAGAREIVLLGQNVNAWHGDGPDGRPWSLARLIRALADVDGLRRIRYTTSHPRDMTDDLIRAHGEVPQLMPWLHLPVQSGSDRVLKAMNRRHRARDYLRLVEKIRASRPDIALSGDFIVGFPGESDADFAATLALVREAGYASAFSFKYSPRPGTPAATAPDQLPEAEKARRLARLQSLLEEQRSAFNHATLGRRLDVLMEKPGRRPGQLLGRSPYLQAVHVEAGGELLGGIATVTLTRALAHSMAGVLDPPAAGGGGR